MDVKLISSTGMVEKGELFVSSGVIKLKSGGRFTCIQHEIACNKEIYLDEPENKEESKTGASTEPSQKPKKKKEKA
jgi:hypothetical protein